MVNDNLEIGGRFWNNVSALLGSRGKPAKWLAREVGISPAAISKYARGSVPNLTAAVKIARRLNVSLDLLVSATQAEVLAVDAASSATQHRIEQLELENQAGRRLIHELGLGRVALLAEKARMVHDRAVIRQLALRYPAAMTPHELAVAAGRGGEPLDLSAVRAALMALQARGQVEELASSPALFRATTRVQEQSWQDVRDTAAHVIESIRCLCTEVLPALHRSSRNARLELSQYRIRPGQQSELVGRTVRLLRELRREFDSGEDGIDFVELHAFALPNLPKE